MAAEIIFKKMACWRKSAAGVQGFLPEELCSGNEMMQPFAISPFHNVIA